MALDKGRKHGRIRKNYKAIGICQSSFSTVQERKSPNDIDVQSFVEVNLWREEREALGHYNLTEGDQPSWFPQDWGISQNVQLSALKLGKSLAHQNELVILTRWQLPLAPAN